MQRIVLISRDDAELYGSWEFLDEEQRKVTQLIPINILQKWNLENEKQYYISIEEVDTHSLVGALRGALARLTNESIYLPSGPVREANLHTQENIQKTLDKIDEANH